MNSRQGRILPFIRSADQHPLPVIEWPDSVQTILDADQAVALATTTPARGVVIAPLTNFAANDRARGTVTVNSSVGMWRKLQRIQQNPSVTVAFHTRAHAATARPEFVLMQGDATIGPLDRPHQWYDELGDRWERFGGQSRGVGPLWERWMRAYHWRVNITICVARVLIWSDLRCTEAPTVLGVPLPAPPLCQHPPTGGTRPRVDQRVAAAHARRYPNVLLGYVGSDGFPMVLPVQVTGSDPDGLELDCAQILPGGGRRAGMLAHSFSRYVVGQRQQSHTGWLDVTADRAVYSPHTQHGYHLPPSRSMYNLSAGYVTRRGVRSGQRAGFLPRTTPSGGGR
ncbi:hypothetical protein [Nocardia sp. NPDC049526]|uniref:hypothetical protein n=1 Tax=Nocardia sp. NPDC049526 TaxID=3364316 RepID=UPI0037BCE28F